MDDDLILNELKNLIAEADSIMEYIPDYRKIQKWEKASQNLLKIRFGYNSDYYNDFCETCPSKGNYDEEECIERGTGVLEYVHDALEKGLTEDLFYKKEIIIFSDLLEQAFEFLAKEPRLVAGIYGRIVLETSIKEFAKKNNIHEKKFDQIIIKLRQNNIIQKPLENSLRANYEIGSWAAHGNTEFQDLSNNEIREFLTFIRDKVLTLD